MTAGTETVAEPRTWTAYGFDQGPDYPTRYLHVFVNRRSAEMSRPDETPVELTLIEDPDGDFAGWISEGRDWVSMVQHHRLFNMQFPYGVQAEIDAGHGEMVRLRAEPAESPHDREA